MNNERIRIVRYSALNLRKKLGDTGDTATLQWGMRGVYPRITVYTSNKDAFVDSKPNYNFIITAPFDVVTLEMLLTRLEELLSADNNTKYSMDCLNNKVENGERKDELYIQARVTVGKDDLGVIYIAVTEEGKKKIKFDLLPNSVYFTYQDNEGNKIKDPAILSKLYVKSYIKVLRNLVMKDTVDINKSVVEVDKPDIKRTYNRNAKQSVSDKSYEIDESKLQDFKQENKEVRESQAGTDTGFEEFLD